jgi:hypothetical protein
LIFFYSNKARCSCTYFCRTGPVRYRSSVQNMQFSTVQNMQVVEYSALFFKFSFFCMQNILPPAVFFCTSRVQNMCRILKNLQHWWPFVEFSSIDRRYNIRGGNRPHLRQHPPEILYLRSVEENSVDARQCYHEGIF